MLDALEAQRKILETALKVAGHLKEKSEVDIRTGITAMVVDALKENGEELESDIGGYMGQGLPRPYIIYPLIPQVCIFKFRGGDIPIRFP